MSGRMRVWKTQVFAFESKTPELWCGLWDCNVTGCLVVPMGNAQIDFHRSLILFSTSYSLHCSVCNDYVFHHGINQEVKEMPFFLTQWRGVNLWPFVQCSGAKLFHLIYSMVRINSFPSAHGSLFIIFFICSFIDFLRTPSSHVIKLQ